MKKRLLPLALALPVLLLLSYALSDKLILAVRIAQLYGREPDRYLAMPVQGISKSKVSDSWHAPRSGNRKHEGQDILAPRGTPVLSATEGYVVRVGENRLGGKTVSVMGAGGRVYYYAHLDSYAPNIATGDHVTPQTVLGFVGDTGNAAGTSPHLHFGVYTRGGALNPFPLLLDRPEENTASQKSERPSQKRKR